MKIPLGRWCRGFAALALCAFALPSGAAEATKISFLENSYFYRDGGVTHGNAGFNGGDWSSSIFDGNFADYRYQNTAGAYLVIDLTPICEDPDGLPFVTDILVGHAGNAKYSLYYTTEDAPEEGSTSDDRTWIPVEGAEQVTAGGTKAYGVNAVATAVKYVWDTSLGWGGQSLAEIEVQGYEYVPAKAVKISAVGKSWFYRDGGVTHGNAGFNGGDWSSSIFDGNFEDYRYQNTVGAYLVMDTTVYDENGVSTGAGYYVTEVLVGHAGNTKYSLYYTTEAAPEEGSKSDDRTWIPVEGAEQVTAGGTKSYGVNAVATAVKYVFDTSLGWGGQSLAEIEIWGMDPSSIACLHPGLDEIPWVLVPHSNTCTDYGYYARTCPICGEEFHLEDPEQLPGHDYVATLTRAGTVESYGEGYYECSRCGDHVDFADPANLVTSQRLSFGPYVPGQVRFSSYTVSSIWHGDYGVQVEQMFNGDWKYSYHCWTSVGLDDHVDIYLGAPMDLTSVDVATHNHDHTLLFFNVDDETGDETLIGRQVVRQADGVEEQRFLVPLVSDVENGTVGTHLRLRTTDDVGYSIWGGRGLCIVEFEPYGTIPGANKVKAKAAMIGLNGYDTLAEAFAAAVDGDVITLVGDVSEPGVTFSKTAVEKVGEPEEEGGEPAVATIYAARNVTVDLDGYTWTLEGAPLVADGTGVTLRNGTISTTVVDVFEATGADAAITLGAGLTVGSDTSVFYAHDGGACVVDGADVAIDASTPYTPLYAEGAGSKIEVKAGSVSVDGGIVVLHVTAGATAEISGGAVSTGSMTAIKASGTGSSILVSGGTVSNAVEEGSTKWCVAWASGGAGVTVGGTGALVSEGGQGLVATAGSSVAVTGGSVSVSGADWAVLAHKDGNAAAAASSLTITGGMIVGYVGALDAATATVAGGTVTGGSLQASNGGSFEVSGGTFQYAVPAAFCAEGFVPVAEPDEDTGLYTVKAAWTVSFANDKGDVPESQIVYLDGENDVFATEPAAPEAEGWVFVGWFADGAEEAFDFATPIAGDLALSAVWEEDVPDAPESFGIGDAESQAALAEAGAKPVEVSADGKFVVNVVVPAGYSAVLQGGAGLADGYADLEEGSGSGAYEVVERDGYTSLVYTPAEGESAKFFKVKFVK